MKLTDIGVEQLSEHVQANKKAAMHTIKRPGLTELHIVSALRRLNIWRAEITTSTGRIEIALPPTALRALNRNAFVRDHVPATLYCEFVAMRNPLKTKKFTYQVRRVVPGTVRKIRINASICFGDMK